MGLGSWLGGSPSSATGMPILGVPGVAGRQSAAQYRAMSKPVSLIGAPTDVGASVRGAGMGPDALRVAGLAEALRRHRLEVVDRGNLAGPPNPWLPPQAGVRHLEEVVAWNRAVDAVVAQALADGHVPL